MCALKRDMLVKSHCHFKYCWWPKCIYHIWLKAKTPWQNITWYNYHCTFLRSWIWQRLWGLVICLCHWSPGHMKRQSEIAYLPKFTFWQICSFDGFENKEDSVLTQDTPLDEVWWRYVKAFKGNAWSSIRTNKHKNKERNKPSNEHTCQNPNFSK